MNATQHINIINKMIGKKIRLGICNYLTNTLKILPNENEECVDVIFISYENMTCFNYKTHNNLLYYKENDTILLSILNYSINDIFHTYNIFLEDETDAINLLYIYTEKYITDLTNEFNKIKNELVIESITNELLKSYEYKEKQHYDKIELAKVEVRDYRAAYMRRIEKLENLLSTKFIIDKEKYLEKIKDQMTKIINHNKVEKIEIQNDVLHIFTKKLYMYEPIREKRYYLGCMDIAIRLNESKNIKIYNIDNKRNALWENSNHPHVDNYGYACFGNIDCQLVEYQNENNYYPLFITILNFLQTANIDDEAGKWITKWDEVDEFGNIIQYGFNPDSEEDDFECYECGRRTENTCPRCGNPMCEDHEIFITNTDSYICIACADLEDVWTCSLCNRNFDRNEPNYNGLCNHCFTATNTETPIAPDDEDIEFLW